MTRGSIDLIKDWLDNYSAPEPTQATLDYLNKHGIIPAPKQAVDAALAGIENILIAREKHEMLRAQAVMNAISDYVQAADPKREAVALPVSKAFPAGVHLMSAIDNLQQAVAENLDHSSIGAFIELIVANAESAKQTAAALKRHADNHALRDEIYAWMDANYKKGMALDDAASIISEKIVPLKWRTVRDHLTAWRKLRSTGTP